MVICSIASLGQTAADTCCTERTSPRFFPSRHYILDARGVAPFTEADEKSRVRVSS